MHRVESLATKEESAMGLYDEDLLEMGLHTIQASGKAINMCETKSRGPILIDVEISRNTVTMEIDTGAAVSILSERVYRGLCPTRSGV